jgi:hypothetical protein
MLNVKPISEESHSLIANSDTGRLSLAPNEWESQFFGRSFALLNIDADIANEPEAPALRSSLESLILTSDKLGYELLEVRLNSMQMALLPILEEKGFRLVDTHAVFITGMRKDLVEVIQPEKVKICFAGIDMKTDILNLTHRSFTFNPMFYSRFKNRLYFNNDETAKYYSAYIDNYLGNANTLFAVAMAENRVIGYLIYQCYGEHDNLPLYKGILVAIDREYAGNHIHFALQSFIYRAIPHNEYYLNTTTQLNNIPTLNNYIKSTKRLNKVVLILYRKYKTLASF